MRASLAASHPSRAAERLRKAWEALKRTRYGIARSIASPLKSNPEFGDYARWIVALTDLEQARRSYDSHHLPAAFKLARGAVLELRGMNVSYPYSPLLQRLRSDLAAAELIEARVLHVQKKSPLSMERYQNAFQRIVGTPELVSILPADLESFSEECSLSRTELCLAWIERLGQLYPRSTIEYKALSTHFTGFHEIFPRPASIGKTTQAYRAPDLDMPAFDFALALYMDGKYVDATNALLKFLDEFPRSSMRFRARYWLARALMLQKKDAEASKLLNDVQEASPLTFYGLLAAQATGADIEDALTDEMPLASDSDPFLLPWEVFRLRRAEKLISARALDLAAIELRDFRARDVLSNEFLTYLALLQIQSRSYGRAFGVLNELIARGARDIFSTYVARLIFPVPNWRMVRKYSDENGLDPVLVLSLMKQESSFDPSAISPVGALGLMQLMPATAADIMPDQPRAELVKMETNIKTGTRYLGKLLARFNGNIALSVAAYNAGPGAVDRWIRANPGRGMLEFLEQIPYRETREYVQAIIRNYFWYARKLNPEAFKTLSLDYFWGDSRARNHLIPDPRALDRMGRGDDKDLLFGPPMPRLIKIKARPPSSTPAISSSGSPSPSPALSPSPNPSPSPAPSPSPVLSTGTSTSSGSVLASSPDLASNPHPPARNSSGPMPSPSASVH